MSVPAVGLAPNSTNADAFDGRVCRRSPVLSLTSDDLLNEGPVAKIYRRFFLEEPMICSDC
jgi:hypothetical protein